MDPHPDLQQHVLLWKVEIIEVVLNFLSIFQQEWEMAFEGHVMHFEKHRVLKIHTHIYIYMYKNLYMYKLFMKYFTSFTYGG